MTNPKPAKPKPIPKPIRGLEWHCKECGHTECVMAPYKLGDSEPCINCGEAILVRRVLSAKMVPHAAKPNPGSVWRCPKCNATKPADAISIRGSGEYCECGWFMSLETAKPKARFKRIAKRIGPLKGTVLAETPAWSCDWCGCERYTMHVTPHEMMYATCDACDRRTGRVPPESKPKAKPKTRTVWIVAQRNWDKWGTLGVSMCLNEKKAMQHYEALDGDVVVLRATVEVPE